MTIEKDQQLYRQKFRVALASMAVGVLMIIGFGLVDAFTHLNGWTGVGLGIFYTLASGGYAIWAHRKGHPRTPH